MENRASISGLWAKAAWLHQTGAVFLLSWLIAPFGLRRQMMHRRTPLSA